jgi:mRNA-degrading endonuclease toxin of MazEF toxin-antitoxin module
VINCDELHTVAISLIDNQIATLGADKMHAVAGAVRFALDVECE